MKKDYSEEVKELIKRYKEKGFRYAKPFNFLLERIEATKEEIEKEIINHNNLEFCEKQTKKAETRYDLYFVYSKKRGRVYILAFEDKITIIKVYPIGKRTLKKYKKRFKS